MRACACAALASAARALACSSLICSSWTTLWLFSASASACVAFAWSFVKSLRTAAPSLRAALSLSAILEFASRVSLSSRWILENVNTLRFVHTMFTQ